MAPNAERFLSVSCINVGVGPGGTTNLLARIAIVDYRGATVFDKYVAPTTTVTDYRTTTTGITQAHLNSPDAWTFPMIQTYVSNFFRNKILVGHSLWNDLAVLGLPHPAVDTRDVALYQPFRNTLQHSNPHQIIGLQTLAWQLMARRCQEGQIHPVENARAALDLYRSVADRWEDSVARGNWPCALPPSTFSRCYL
ncbi:ribonuclease H-like domain-containing protein [Flammula alnicola]|nr:ribonuclease H-like domain-containing protein [Flammula alnicola]